MPTIISVTHGQDAGREFAIPRTTIRIGTEAHADIRLTDPQLQGLLTLVWNNGTWVVTHQLDYPILLDGQRFARNETKVWFDGTHLQPTATTSLLLETRDSETAADEPASVQELTLAEPEVAEWVRYVQYTGVAFGLLILLAASDGGTPKPTDQQVDNSYKAAIGSLGNKPAGPAGRFQSDWQLLTENLRQARHADKAGDAAIALNLYEKCSQLCRVLNQTIDELEQTSQEQYLDLNKNKNAIDSVSEFIAQRKSNLD